MMHYYMADFGGFFATNTAVANPSNHNRKTVDELHLRSRRFRRNYLMRRLSLTSRSLSRRIAEYQRNSTAKKELYAMRDYDLAKLGITRGEIELVVSGHRRRGFSTLLTASKKYFGNVWANVEKAMRMRAGYRELMAMTDVQLADLGLSRGMIPDAVRGNLSQHQENGPSVIAQGEKGGLTVIDGTNNQHIPPNDNKQHNDHRHAV
ncbi:MAG: DUF1127 domain-containing protein [Sneathiella sp.]|uniref:DUF1127 domain-containing protein n=1 Tax=Sneathiella sp. TaxID=1964365 RepID=UPI00300103E5